MTLKKQEKLWLLGVPAQVKHNEVAPRQYELVPHFENLKSAANHKGLQQPGFVCFRCLCVMMCMLPF